MKNENKMRLAVIDFLEKRLKDLEYETKNSDSEHIKRFTLETYLTTKHLLERMKSEQKTKAIQAAEELWHQGF